jgi:hypothetical protein
MASVVGGALYLGGRPVHASAAPFTAHWLPQAGPGTPPAIAVAAAVVCLSPRFAATTSWPRLLAVTYLAAVGWILALALVDGWQRGLAGRLTTKDEYLSEVGGVADVPAMLRGFAGRILDFQPDSWTTHVSGHSPGAFLVFIALDWIGLGGGGWAAIACVLAGALVAIAVPVTLRTLGDEIQQLSLVRAVLDLVVIAYLDPLARAVPRLTTIVSTCTSPCTRVGSTSATIPARRQRWVWKASTIELGIRPRSDSS